MQPAHKNRPSGVWKTLIASLSITSLIGLVNLFSNRDVKSANAQVIEALLNNPVPTLVPAAQVTITAPPQPTSAPTAMLVIVPTYVAPAVQPAYIPPTAFQSAPAVVPSNPAPAVTKATTPKKTTTTKPATKTSSSKK